MAKKDRADKARKDHSLDPTSETPKALLEAMVKSLETERRVVQAERTKFAQERDRLIQKLQEEDAKTVELDEIILTYNSLIGTLP